mgnify:CR=1 FL=1
MKNYLIFAQRTSIRKISLDVDYYADVSLPMSSLKNAIALSVDRVDGKCLKFRYTHSLFCNRY